MSVWLFLFLPFFSHGQECLEKSGRMQVSVRAGCHVSENGVERSYNSMGYREKEMTPPSSGTYRILLLGPGLESPALPMGQLAARNLQKELNRHRPDITYEVLNGAIDGFYSPRNFQQLRKTLKEIAPDLVLYYQSSRNFPWDLWAMRGIRVDDDEILRERPCRQEDFVFFTKALSWFSDDVPFLCETQRMIGLGRKIRSLRARLRGRALTEAILEDTNQSFRSISLLRTEFKLKKTLFVVLMAPESVRFDRMTFRSYHWKDLLLNFLTPSVNLSGEKILRASVGNGYRILGAPSSYAALYTAPYLMKDSLYVFNPEGQALWASLTAKLLKPYLTEWRQVSQDQIRLPLDHMNGAHEEPGGEDSEPAD